MKELKKKIIKKQTNQNTIESQVSKQPKKIRNKRVSLLNEHQEKKVKINAQRNCISSHDIQTENKSIYSEMSPKMNKKNHHGLTDLVLKSKFQIEDSQLQKTYLDEQPDFTKEFYRQDSEQITLRSSENNSCNNKVSKYTTSTSKFFDNFHSISQYGLFAQDNKNKSSNTLLNIEKPQKPESTQQTISHAGDLPPN